MKVYKFIKTLFYYFKWLFKQFEFDPIYIVFLSVILFLTGIIMNAIGLTVHTYIDPVTGKFTVWRDEYWSILGDKFLFAGFGLFAMYLFWSVVIKGIRNSFRKFKQEQNDLLKTIDRGRR